MTTFTYSEMSSKHAETTETAYLLRSQKNARRLIESIAELDSVTKSSLDEAQRNPGIHPLPPFPGFHYIPSGLHSLLRSPKNARRLIESIAELDSGSGKKRKLMELRNLCKRTPSCR
ncbi:MAG: hypothetical protein EPO31_07125 [Gammaproteobacteria bacterium]|nr:MAG: hypothetical protein EPO31_07125 [Gammaproteobacteria bacterium]